MVTPTPIPTLRRHPVASPILLHAPRYPRVSQLHRLRGFHETIITPTRMNTLRHPVGSPILLHVFQSHPAASPIFLSGGVFQKPDQKKRN
jgi:hypothetical protein